MTSSTAAVQPTQTSDILALGEAMIEFNQSAKDQPNYLQGFGGDTSNFCIAAARQGAKTGFVSAVGADHFGRLLVDLWEREQVDTSLVKVDAQASTGVYFVSHGPEGHAFDYLRAGSAASRSAAALQACRIDAASLLPK